MKAKVLLIGFLWLPLCSLLPAPQEKINDQSFPLDMAVNSVDDMYSTCAAQMEAKVKKTYFDEEMKMKDNGFSKAWNAAKNCMNKKTEDKDDALTKDHRRAICVYTAGGKEEFYKVFNEAVRTNKQQYSSSFPFHSLHFWLTRAIQILKTNHNECYTTFRRTGVAFTGKVEEEIRFGFFASSSILSTLTKFGKTTCFKITTCHGAYLKEYPVLGDHEQEVLIPPYEKFEITLILINKDKPAELSDCETVYVLESKGVQSNLNCQVANQSFCDFLSSHIEI